ncbi:hypothetical protein J4466_00830 [Candidatus Pacearchaeota archaeon]|nr:hypothetical protein [Candidatus Pacearchaeota archaeon]
MAEEKTKKSEKITSNSENSNETIEKPFDYKKVNYQVIWVIVVLVAVLISFFATMWILSEANKYDYIGLTFKKEMFGNIPLHTTQYTGYGANGWPTSFKLALRNDPRELSVPIEGKLKFITSNLTYVSIDRESGILGCSDSTIALSSLGIFMNNMKIIIKSAVTSQNASVELNKTIVTCNNSLDNTVLIITAGNESKIFQDKNNSNCYTLSVNNCEIVPVIERFEVATIAEVNDEDIDGYDG